MKSSIFKIALLLSLGLVPRVGEAAVSVMPADEGNVLQIPTLSIESGISLPDSMEKKDSVLVMTKYDRRVHRYRKNWGSLIPTQVILQTCGNMGLFSLGIGWDYGKRRQWETQLLLGFIPKYNSKNAKMTMTLKENYTPWAVDLKKDWTFEPLECGLYFNTVFGSEFWTKQPAKFRSGYYQFSTRIRPNIFLGQRISKEVPKNKRKFIKSLTLFYELSTNDIYFMRLWHDGGKAEFWDVFGLSLGLKAQLF